MELSGYFAVARRWWWTLLVAAWVAGLAGFYFASRIDPTYESTVELVVGPINTDADTLRGAGLMIQTYGQLATTETVLTRTLGDLGLDMPARPARGQHPGHGQRRHSIPDDPGPGRRPATRCATWPTASPRR